MPDPCLVIACGALAREIQHLKTLNAWHHMTLQCLDAALHNTPAKIPALLASKIKLAESRYQKIFIAYGDCGTQGKIDELIEAHPHISRLPGPHCFAAFAGKTLFEQMNLQDPGIFWLTDFLVRHFDTMVVESLGLNQHPELLPLYFGHYSTAVYLSQEQDEQLLVRAKQAAKRLNLNFQHRAVGYQALEQPLAWVAA
jgi:hypothetical protein